VCVIKLAFCGDVCNYCPRYIATLSGNEEELTRAAEIMKKVGWPYNLEDPKKMKCRGCQDVKSCEYKVKECCIERKIKNCGMCVSYPCVKIENAFEKTKINANNFKKILSPEEYKVFSKAYFSKKNNLTMVRRNFKKELWFYV